MSNDIGARIKSLRKSLHLTQAQLAGDSITRNMLSLIENGDASPSIKTLEYIAERLGVSPAYFFMSRPMREASKEADKLGEIRSLYKSKEYARCLGEIEARILQSTDGTIADEFLLLAAECALTLGKRHALKGAFESASVQLAKAHEYAGRCAYNTEWIDTTAYLYEAIIENSDNPLQAIGSNYFLAKRRAVEDEMFGYLTLLRLAEEYDPDAAKELISSFPLLERAHKEHTEAKCDLYSAEPEEQDRGLNALCEMIKNAPSYPLDTVTRYLILRDIEYGTRAKGDFEKAYRYASMRLKIINDMRD